MKKRMVQRLFSLFFTSILLVACEDQSDSKKLSEEATANAFLKAAKDNPVNIDGNLLSDSWRLTRETSRFYDEAETTIDYLSVSEFDCYSIETSYYTPGEEGNAYYKEYWTIGAEEVLHTYKLSQTGEKWDFLNEGFSSTIDPEDRSVTIGYISEGGDKTYIYEWAITSLTDTELILTAEGVYEDNGGNYYIQYTFRRENF